MSLPLKLSGLAVAATLVAGALPAVAAPATGLGADGLSLVSFDTTNPGAATSAAITGLEIGEVIVGVDQRPRDGKLYGVVRSASGASTRIVTIDRTTRVATPVALLASNGANSITAPGTSPVVLQGQLFGADFNPMADALRVVSDQEQNLRINPGNRVAGGPAGATAIDTNLTLGGVASPGLNVVSAAYSNNVPGATSTILYVLDTVSDQLFQQSPANGGTLINPVSLSENLVGQVGFDIDPNGNAFVTGGLDAQGAPIQLFSLDVTTGQLTAIGSFGLGITDISVTPIPAALPLLATAVGGLAFVARRKLRAAA